MKKYICIHGHFYQPPRENPWLDEVEVQDSAAPFHDWNQRITSECYGRNSASRILDGEGNVLDIVSNYSKMSFNFGPTLLSWMERNDPESYEAILEADKISMKRFGGHGSAIAQVYNHIIMPLANARDKRTQIVWGIKDFRSRFQRMPEGMWLAETAVDLETLDILSEYGIKFTILAPHQAKGIRPIGDDSVQLSPVDPKMPYLCKLPSGRKITLFFYDGPTSQSVAFEGLLEDGSKLANRLLGCFNESSPQNQLVHIATDGETYGHHHKFGDMALAYAFHYIEQDKKADLINYGLYLEKFPLTHEAEIVEDSSWSCVHGIERWRNNCGCCSGMNGGWHQNWRAPLRKSFDWLRDQISPLYEQEMKKFVNDPWKVRDDYIDVLLDRSQENVADFIKSKASRSLTDEEKSRFLKLLETQNNALLMYTSCGWFFDEVSGIETVQCMKYAARVIQLSSLVFKKDFELDYVTILGEAPSNISDIGTGARAYQVFAKPSVVNLTRVAVHYAITSLYKNYEEQAELYSYTVDRLIHEVFTAGRQRLLLGRVKITSNITWDHITVCFAVFHMGDHNFVVGARKCQGEDAYNQMKDELCGAFNENNIQLIIHGINKFFPGPSFSLWHLFKREQQDILDEILKETMGDVEESFREIYEKHYSLIQIKDEIRLSLPKTFINVVEFVLRREFSNELEGQETNIPALKDTVNKLKSWAFQRDRAGLVQIASDKINQLVSALKHQADDIDYLRKTVNIIRILMELELPLELWHAQNVYFLLMKKTYPNKKKSPSMIEWVELFEELGVQLKVQLDAVK